MQVALELFIEQGFHGTSVQMIASRAGMATMETVFKYVTCDGKRVDINATFTGRNKELWQVFIAALRFNFSDFLPAGLFASVQSAVTK